MSFTSKQNVHDVTAPVGTDLKEAISAASHFEPSYDRILLVREKSAVERKLAKSGLITADTIKDAYKSSEGYLLKCGPTADDEAVKLIGKRVLFAKYSGEDIIVPLPDGSKFEFVLATDSDIFGELK
jgi:co-chaperonin GroES (HSP10)